MVIVNLLKTYSQEIDINALGLLKINNMDIDMNKRLNAY